MTANPKQFNPSRITQLLNISTRQITPEVASALQKTRQHALSRQKAHSRALALSSGHGLPYALFDSFPVQDWMAAGLLVAMLVIGSGYWQHIQQEDQIADTDVAILTDDLPIDAFVD